MNNLRQTLAQVISSVNAPVERLGKDTYIINGVLAQRAGHAWTLITERKDKFTIYHSKVAVMLPWILAASRKNTHLWLLQETVLKLDREYSWALFELENQSRILEKYIKQKNKESAEILFVKYHHTKKRMKNINWQISKALSGVKINK